MSEFKEYVGYEFVSDTSKIDLKMKVVFCLALLSLATFILYVAQVFAPFGDIQFLGIILTAMFIGFGTVLQGEKNEMYETEYLDYLDNLKIKESSLYAISQSPEYDDETKKKVIKFLNEKRSGWTLRNEFLWHEKEETV
ncbi:MAG: hypothetical protein C9356_20095 [Oleiphilus sp.]|nr:MAG: hypothetical protein C9356_20095 [Oleiphilus sp.]